MSKLSYDFPRKLFGAVLGKGGATIKAIESKSGARVSLPARDAPESDPIVISGTPDQISAAVAQIKDVSGTAPVLRGGGAAAPAPVSYASAASSSSSSSSVSSSSNKPIKAQHKNKVAAESITDDGMLRLFVPESSFGALIGPKGESVRQLEANTGAKIKIPRDNDAERAVRVLGNKSQIAAAVVAIERIIGFAPSTKPIVTRSVNVPAGSIGKLIGEGGSTLRRLEADSDCGIDLPRKGSADSRVLISGNEDSIANAIKLMSALVGQDLSIDNAAAAASSTAAGAAVDAPPPTSAEIADITKALAKLWHLDDAARLEPGREIQLNVQAAVAVHNATDASHEKFFKSVDPAAFTSPTIRAFVALLDNFDSCTNAAEFMSANEKEETWHFLHAACNTVPMRYAFEWCKANGGPVNEVAWKLALFNLWFGTFSRGAGVASSSAFEHVFVGEVKNNEVTGFHNWLQFYHEEKAGKVDYRGYVVPHRRGQPVAKATGKEPVLSIKFAWGGEVKPVSTFLIGTTPEFELALYTMVFFSKKETIVADFADFDVEIICHRFQTRDGDRIGSAYFDVKQ